MNHTLNAFVYFETANKPTSVDFLEAFEKAFEEGNSNALGDNTHEAKVFKATKTGNMSCVQEDDGKQIVCSAYDLDVTFNIMHVVSMRITMVGFLGLYGGEPTHIEGRACFLPRAAC